MTNKSLKAYITLCKKHDVEATLRGLKLWSVLCDGVKNK